MRTKRRPEPGRAAPTPASRPAGSGTAPAGARASSAPSVRPGRAARLVPVLLFPWGVLTAFWPAFASGFDLLPGDYGDGRLNHYFLEHGWRWIAGDPLHARF